MKLIDHTLKNPRTGEWSRKNCTAAFSVLFAAAYSGIGMLLDKTVHEFVVWGFLTLAGSMLGVSSWEKLNIKKAESSTKTQESTEFS